MRLGLSTDGMSLFTYGSPYGIWPVTVVVYNLPPWICIKQEYFIMPLLIPGPNSPCNDIDVYLRPLFEELKTLWCNGVKTYDASTGTKFNVQYFCGQSVIFQFVVCCLVGVLKVSWLVHHVKWALVLVDSKAMMYWASMFFGIGS